VFVIRETVTVNGVTYRTVQLDLPDGRFTLDGEPFTPGRRWYGTGTWLVQGPDDAYARAMTDQEYRAWRGIVTDRQPRLKG
jgi:hypothetical protein